MKTKTLLVTSLLAVLAFTGLAQTNTPPPVIIPTNEPPVVNVITQLEEFLSGAGTNLILVPYGIISTGSHLGGGGGVALAYELNQFVVPAFRLEYLNKAFYQGSITTQLQLPIALGPTTLIPFGLAGAAMPFGGGSGSNGGTVQGVAGLGLALKFNGTSWLATHIDLLGDWEVWSATKGDQYRLGLAIKF